MSLAVDDIIKEALKQGSKTWGELQEIAAAKGVSHATYSEHFRRLRDREKILLPHVRVTDGGYGVEYELVPEGLGGDIESRLKKIIAQFVEITDRCPTPQEVALELGVTPEEASKVLFQTSRATNWSPPSEAKVKSADEKLGGALYVAALMNDHKELVGMNWATPEETAKAQQLLEEYPDIVPHFDGGTLRWPEKTSRYLTTNYDPTKRPSVC